MEILDLDCNSSRSTCYTEGSSFDEVYSRHQRGYLKVRRISITKLCCWRSERCGEDYVANENGDQLREERKLGRRRRRR